jgi:dienelactone hydrolase
MGRHIIGYEVQKTLAAVDWFNQRGGPAAKIGVAGYGEGGLIAFYAAAADTRIDAALVSGYFTSRQSVWSEPIYRSVWALLEEFGDAEIATLIAPRGLVVEYSEFPRVENQKGDIVTPPAASVKSEFDRIASLVTPADFQSRKLITATTPVALGSNPALEAFAEMLGTKFAANSQPALTDRRKSFNPAERQRRQVRELETHVQALVRNSEHVRDNWFLFKLAPQLGERAWTRRLRHESISPDAFIEGAKKYREYFSKEVIGRFDDPLLPPNARTRKIYDNDSFAGYDVVLDVYPDVIAWGILLVPKDIQAAEKRPVVVCQHGRQGVPSETVEGDTEYYHDFAARLAQRGFVTFSPHNLYRGEDRYRWLDRKANSVKASMFSFIVAQHDQILNWFGTLPFVDPSRIAFYGLSYGGETAVRVPTIVEKYALSICSGDFNNWTRKIAATDQPFSFMYTIEWEMPYFDMGSTFDYADMTYLMIPRPFMVERGHHDRVGRDRWVAHEYAKVRWLYTQFGLADKTEIEYFNGGHTINAEGTFDFLHKHLNWPKR